MAMTEHLWSVGTVDRSVKIGNKIISYDHNGSFSISDTSNGSSYRYSGPSLSGNSHYGGFYENGISAFLVCQVYSSPNYSEYMLRVNTDGTTNAHSLFGYGYATNNFLGVKGAISGDYIVASNVNENKMGIYKISTQTTTYSNSPGWMGWPARYDDAVYVANSTSITEVDPSNGGTINTIPANFGSAIVGVGQQFGNSIYWPESNGILKLDLISGTTSFKTLTPSGGSHGSNSIIGSDGYLYSIKSSNVLTVIDPETGQWKNNTLSPSRDGRNYVFCANDKLWIPSGKPDTWD